MLRYANNSNYKNDSMIRKEVHVTDSVLKELRRIIEDSEILKYVDVYVKCTSCGSHTTV